MATKMRPKGGDSLTTLPDSYIVFDVETTGLSFNFCRMIEIGAVRVEKGTPIDSFDSLIYCPDTLTTFITELTGINDSMLASAPEEEMVIRAFADYVGDSVLLAHNANFDMTFLYLAYERHLHRPLENDFVDTLRVARKALPDLECHKAIPVCNELKVVNRRPHRALPDAEAENEAYLIMREMLLQQYGEEGYQRLFHGARKRKLRVSDIAAAEEPDEDNPLFGMSVVFTGAMETMQRKAAKQALKNAGGNPQDNVTLNTNYLVIGNNGFQKSHVGPSGSMKKAQDYQLRGVPIEVISEDVFLEMLDS